jgi:iron complex transport system ATP-binding protein
MNHLSSTCPISPISPRSPILLTVQAVALAHAGCQPFVRDINFELAAGESLVILGPNGSGKTTLLRTILGLMLPASGTISFGEKVENAAHQHCAYVPQISVGFSGFSATQVIQMGLMAGKPWYAQPSAKEGEGARAALDSLGIITLVDADFSTLSGGEQQLVLIARALAINARIIVLDEPAASLDIANQAQFIALCLRLKQSGVALILTTHNPQHALALGVAPNDQTLTISRAGDVQVGATASVCTSERLSALYGVAVEVLETPRGAVIRV